MVYKPTPFDNPSVYGTPSSSDAELRALIDEMKNTNPGALAPPPKRPRERVPGMQKMISKVSGTKQGTRIPGLGFVKDAPDPDEDEMGPLPLSTAPPTEMSVGARALGRSFDPFSAAGKNIEPLGLSPKNIAGVTAMAAPIGLGMAGIGGGLLGAAGLGALGGAGSELFGNRDPSLGDIASGAETGALLGPIFSKAMPAVGGAMGRLLPKGNDAKVAAEMGRGAANLAPKPSLPPASAPPARPPMQARPDTMPMPDATKPGYLGPPLKAPPIPATQPGFMPNSPTLPGGPGATVPGRMVPSQTQASGPPPGMTAPGNLAPRPKPPVSPGFRPNESTVMYPPMQTGAMSNQPVNFGGGGGGGTVNQRFGAPPAPKPPMQFGNEYDTLVQPRSMVGNESPSVGGMTPTPALDPTLVRQTGQTMDAIPFMPTQPGLTPPPSAGVNSMVAPFMPTQMNPTRVTPPGLGSLSMGAPPNAQAPFDPSALLDRLRQQNPALYYALIAGSGAGFGGAGVLGAQAMGGPQAAPPEVPPSSYAVQRPYAVQR